MYTDTKTHYDMLIDEGNDPVFDPEPLKNHMDKWDGERFIEELRLSEEKTVLEIGVGTGRLAKRVCGLCKSFCGIDISPKTIEKAKQNLKEFENIKLICGDFLTWHSDEFFDDVYSSLTFFHFEDKKAVINKVYRLLKNGGRFVLSNDKNQETELDFGARKLTLYPETADNIEIMMKNSGFSVKRFETEFADIFVADKLQKG